MGLKRQLVLLSAIVAVGAAAGQSMAATEVAKPQTIYRTGSQASVKGSAEYFTGTVRVDPLFPATEFAPFAGGRVTFEPGARSAWHIHPTGQHLLVIEGVGLIQQWGGAIEEIKAGDVVSCPPGIKHWHGATPTTSMTHIAITGTVNGRNVQWLEKVSDEQYTGKRRIEPMNQGHALTLRQQAVIPIAAFTASGDVEKLKTALHEGLSAGLTVNEIKEILVQMYAYAGFPRSLNGINTFMSVMDERQAKGIKDQAGKEASPFPANKSSVELGTDVQTRLVGKPVTGPIYTFAPAIDQFLKGHLFGDIFGRDNLDFQSREIATISALANMEGVTSQLQAHFNVGLNTGLTNPQMKSLITIIDEKVGKKEANKAKEIFGKVLSGRTE
jgi:4-carboxymuconolactone decarboxylase